MCDRSWRLRCSNRANERVQVVQTCGRGLSVLGGGKVVAGGCVVSGFAVCTEAVIEGLVSYEPAHWIVLPTVAAAAVAAP